MKFLRFWFPVFAYSGIIFYVSSLQGFAPSVDFTDKIAHVIEYSLFGFLSARAFSGTTGFSKRYVWWLAVGLAFLYGLSDEFHQAFVPTRNSEWADVAADVVGGMIGSVLFLWRLKFLNHDPD